MLLHAKRLACFLSKFCFILWRFCSILCGMSESSALYRKYRPKSFKEVIGQEHIVKTLEGALSLGRVFHAYLFAGSRGTGKTSVARIVAEAIGTSGNDVYEIDAASNRGIDDIRSLREGVATLPFESKYKVYIVDEAHMLTKEAWNALLKTLEEPPAHVVFIFATTESDKVPETILSRCQVFQFKKPTREILRHSVAAIAKAEGAVLEAGAAELIALLGDGSFRDTQGILQKVLSASKDRKVSLPEVETVTGAPRGSLVNSFIEALENKKIEPAVAALHKALESNVDAKVFLRLVLQKLRFVLLLRYAKETEKELAEEVSPDNLVFLQKLAAAKDSSISSALLSELLSAYEHIGRAYIPALPIELVLIKLFPA